MDNYLSCNVELPDTLCSTLPSINGLMNAFNLPRELIASDEEIIYAWQNLPREISRIPSELRNGIIVKMCVAVSVGLFDGAINYIWNAVIITIRQKIRNFGFSLIGQTLGKKFEESDLIELKDSELLDLCYKIQLLSEEGYFFLNQCRDIRNNFSIAHPSVAKIDDRELINFISRCCKYGITDDYSVKGIKIADFITAVKGRKLDDDELEVWAQRLSETFQGQRQLLIRTLMGIYCDADSTEESRLNALRICLLLKDYMDESIQSSLIDQYNEYFSKRLVEKCSAAKFFFEKLKMLNLLSETEQHSIVKKACKNLIDAHLGYNNFYNEPPFAERLYEISKSMKIPDTAKQDYVYAVLMGFVGNPYGVSNSAVWYYEMMIRDFSPKEINCLLSLNDSCPLFANKVSNHSCCRNRYLDAISMIEEDSMDAQQITKREKIISKLKGK